MFEKEYNLYAISINTKTSHCLPLNARVGMRAFSLRNYNLCPTFDPYISQQDISSCLSTQSEIVKKRTIAGKHYDSHPLWVISWLSEPSNNTIRLIFLIHEPFLLHEHSKDPCDWIFDYHALSSSSLAQHMTLKPTSNGKRSPACHTAIRRASHNTAHDFTQKLHGLRCWYNNCVLIEHQKATAGLLGSLPSEI